MSYLEGNDPPSQPSAFDASAAAPEELFERARRGSMQDWEALYLAARPQLYRFARVRLATDDQAEDAVSETFARAIQAAPRYRRGPGIMAWMIGICRNVVLESYRNGGRLRSVDPAMFRREDRATHDLGPAERALAAEEADVLRRCFYRLPDHEQELLALRVVAQLEAEAVADILGKRAGAVRMAQSRAVARLRTFMEEDG